MTDLVEIITKVFAARLGMASGTLRCDAALAVEALADAGLLTRSRDLERKLNEMQLHDDTGDAHDEGYMAAVNEIWSFLASEGE